MTLRATCAQTCVGYPWLPPRHCRAPMLILDRHLQLRPVRLCLILNMSHGVLTSGSLGPWRRWAHVTQLRRDNFEDINRCDW